MMGTVANWPPRTVWLYTFGPFLLAWPLAALMGVWTGWFPFWFGLVFGAFLIGACGLVAGPSMYADTKRRYGR